VVKNSAAHFNAVFVVASGYFGYVSCMLLLMVLFGLLVVAALCVLAGAGENCITVSSRILKHLKMAA
jgi:hypothetical protein